MGVLICRPTDQILGFVPSDTSIGDGLAVIQRRQVAGENLPAFLQIALQHDSPDGTPSAIPKIQDRLEHSGLPGMLLSGIRMGTIDDDRRLDTDVRKKILGLFNVFLIIIRSAAPASHNDMAGSIPACFENAGSSILIDSDETVTVLG